MNSMHTAGAVLGAGLRSAWLTATSAYLRENLLAGRSEGFAEAFALADQIPGWFDELSAAEFWAVIHEIRPRIVVEIGSYLGRSTVFTAEALRHAGIDARLHAIDPHTGDKQQLEQLGLTNLPTLDLFRVFLASSGNAESVELHVAPSRDVLQEWEGSIDFLFVDGWHEYEAVLADVRGFGAFLSASGIVCIDDVGAYDEVDQASRLGLAELGLTRYGTIGAKGWAGRSPSPPECLRGALAFQRRLADPVFDLQRRVRRLRLRRATARHHRADQVASRRSVDAAV
jgi:predicted O-methyltransferase YrrM